MVVVVGLLGCWVVGLLGCWVVGLCRYLGEQLASLVQFHDPTQPLFTTPLSRFGTRIHYDIKEYDPLLDSSNMSYVRDRKRVWVGGAM
jgi:hypothetical protein